MSDKAIKLNYINTRTNAIDAKLPVNVKKLEDLQKLLPYIPEDKKPFYAGMVTWLATSHHDEDQSVDE
jgi:hypothetical protein